MPRSIDFLDDFRILMDRVRRLESRLGSQPQFVTYSVSGDLSVQAGGLRWYAPFDGRIARVYASLGTASGGTGVRISLNKNGVSVGMIMLAAGMNYDSFTPDDPDFYEEDFYTVDIVSVGSGPAGSNLVVQLKL
jgi:hypothetical protein